MVVHNTHNYNRTPYFLPKQHVKPIYGSGIKLSRRRTAPVNYINKTELGKLVQNFLKYRGKF